MYTFMGVHLCQSPLQDGKYVQTAMSVEHPILPPQPGIVRAQVSVQEVLTSSFPGPYTDIGMGGFLFPVDGP